jgi:carboxyl-terminal processing protease
MDKLKTMFPPDGIVQYPGIGIAPRLINGRYYVAFIYADTPAARADILTGDELLTVDGHRYSPVRAFQGKVGQTVKLAIRRVQNGPVLEREVAVEALIPNEAFTASNKNSGRVIERGGHKFGYIRMYTYAGEEFGKILVDTISSDKFASVDALILDIRGRWGGAPLDAAEVFVGGTPSVEFITPANETRTLNFRWTKPLVVIIGSETRSGLEIMAYSLKKAGFPMIGTTTKGAVVGGAPFILSDGSLLEIPGIDVRVDGQRIEGVGVSPTVPVDYILEYSQGGDPALTAALEAAINKLENQSREHLR